MTRYCPDCILALRFQSANHSFNKIPCLKIKNTTIKFLNTVIENMLTAGMEISCRLHSIQFCFRKNSNGIKPESEMFPQTFSTQNIPLKADNIAFPVKLKSLKIGF